jgi:hypothetical protein
MSAAPIFAFIQLHHFLLPQFAMEKDGYAFFVHSVGFSGNESVQICAEKPLPYVNEPCLKLDAYDREGRWLQSDAFRVKTAMSSLPESGKLRVLVDGNEVSLIDFDPKKSLSSAHDFSFERESKGVRLRWESVSSASTYWLFYAPADAADVLKSVRPLTSVMHSLNEAFVSYDALPEVPVRFLVRANRIWEGGTFWGFDAESWGASEFVFSR